MSLWTPGGEHEVPREPATSSAGTAAAGSPQIDLSKLPPEIRAELEQLPEEQRAQALAALADMLETQERIASAPAADVVSNHLMGLYELGAIHLQQDPPNFAEASIAIDAMRAVLDALGPRLGEHHATLQNACTQIQNAFVQFKSEFAAEAESTPTE
jgi:DNA-binding transcriptional ArsR family regulator